MDSEDPDPSRIYQAFRWLVFRIGKTRWLGWKHFPFVVTWAAESRSIDLNEVLLEALPRAQAGDVLLHRDRGFLGNVAIGGAMVHAGLYVGGDQVVEAVAEGVLRRHAAHILFSDYAMIVRPVFDAPAARELAIREALGWAERIVGFPYDPLFRFGCRRQRELILHEGRERAVQRKVRFCCTKVPYFCYFDRIEELGLKRRRATTWLHRALSWVGLHPGRTVVDADMYVHGRFELVWASRKTTPEWARRRRSRPEYVRKLEEYWAREAASGSSAGAGRAAGATTSVTTP